MLRAPSALMPLLLVLLGAPSAARADCAAMDDPLQVLDLHLEIAPEDWEIVRQQHSRDDPESFIERPARFRCGDEAWSEVMVRRKQGAAWPVHDFPDKFPMKIDFDDLVEDGEWHGHRKIVLENGGADVLKALFREGLAWLLHGRAGMIAGGMSWARLHVNGRFLGVFVRVEEYDKAFLRRHLDEDDGFLYRFDYKEPGSVQRLTRIGEPDPFAPFLCFPPFGAECEPPPRMAEVVAEHTDLEQLTTFAALNAFLANWDAPFMGDNNYFWYNSEPRQRLYFPWDLDLVLRQEDIGLDVHGDGAPKPGLWRSVVLADPAIRARFDASLARLLSDVLSPQALDRLLDELQPALAPAFDADPASGLGTSLAEEIEAVRAWLHLRIAIVRPQVPRTEPYPLVINEVLAWNREGRRDETGERADWVELFHRGKEPLPLDNLFLSDDPARPLRWPLPAGTLEPGGRLLVWCDGDLGEGPAHASFRLDPDGDVLGLYEATATDHRVRDFVRFHAQEPDVALGRLPDGGPGFQRLACPTPEAPNAAACASPRFIRGDASPDGSLDLTDAVAILGGLFLGAGFECRLAADADLDRRVDLTDAVAILLHLFQAGPSPPAPFPACGEDPGAGLDCAASGC